LYAEGVAVADTALMPGLAIDADMLVEAVCPSRVGTLLLVYIGAVIVVDA
jgi:hypothetical protein